MNNEIKVSVRNLVEFVLRAGDLDTTFMGTSRALEGTKAHRKIQKSYDDYYSSEVFLKHFFCHNDFSITVEGRADGIFTEGEITVIDEIKTTTKSLEDIDEDFNPLHWAQAKCYGYIYGVQNELETIDIQLTYYQLDSEEMKFLRKSFAISELEEFFLSLIDKYLQWTSLTFDWVDVRDSSIKDMEFPFSAYRKGQRELAVGVYKTILEGKNLFVQAPTGIGKTISCLFPAVKSVGEGLTSKIFYLTAKTITRQVALDSLEKMRTFGLKLKSIVITAKEKICFCEEVSCNPQNCTYAKGHFDRVNDAIMDALKNEDNITREIVESYAEKHKVCPFELSLDLSIFADCVICDYNYVFDPRASLKRFFGEEGGDYTFLIDEAHNLVDRAREMFSAEINKEPFLQYKKYFKDTNPYLSKSFGNLNSFMLKAKKLCGEEKYFVRKEIVEDIYSPIAKTIKELEPWLLQNKEDEKYKELLEIYFNLLGFIRIWELYDERFMTYGEKNSEDVRLKLFCLDPSYLLGETLKKGRSAVFFSATLTPLEYFRNLLGGREEDYMMRIASPFEQEQLLLLIADHISTRYKDRQGSYLSVVHSIEEAIKGRKGNYFVFFPSYDYMNEVYKMFVERNPNTDVMLQSSSMEEAEREEFLKKFQVENEETMVAFAVLGGIFSEGIDLIGDKLIGAIIVGVGLPQICLERDIIRDYFKEKNNLGYEYAYMYPGMTKILQAAGRVIRTEEDKGMILLIDDRFTTRKYLNIFPREWNHFKRVQNVEMLRGHLGRFWG